MEREERAARLRIEEQVPLALHTTLGVGGPARYFAEARSVEQAVEGIRWARERNLPLLVLGGGSNLLVADSGFPGLVLRCAIRGVAVREDGQAVVVRAGAGEDWDALVALAVERGWAGIECLSGIPGLVGAAPIQNIGAYGQEVRETIVEVEALNLEALDCVRFSNDECRFGYRESRFKLEDRGRYLVVAVTYRLVPGGAPAVRYAELERRLAERGAVSPTLAEVRSLVIEIRRGKSMVLDAGDPDARSAGSFFVNPVVSDAELADLERRETARLGEEPRIPRFPAGEGRVKVPAAWLIERAGFAKGYRRGPAGLSTKHTLAIVNRDGARAEDIAALAREIRNGVRERFGITLTPEPVFVGLSLDEL